MTKDNIAFQIALGIFIGIAATSSLEGLLSVNMPDILWLLFSIIIIFLAVIFIYSMMLESYPKNMKVESIRMISIFLVSFLPFSIRKMLISSQIISSNWTWSFGWVILHGILLVVLLVCWSLIKKPKNKTAPIVIGVIFIFIFAVIYTLEKSLGMFSNLILGGS